MIRSSLACVAALVLTACLTASSLPTRPNEKEWKRLSNDYSSLETLRRSSTQTPTAGTRKERLEVEIENYRKIEAVYSDFLERLREYYERTADPRAAQLYSREKTRLADEYMNLLARYDKAINLYREAIAIDPANEEAHKKLALAEKRRFVAIDDFANVRPGMNEDEVRRIVGMPREDWIRQVVQKGRAYSVWIYPKKDGGASAVYFDSGVVYHTNWNAAPARAESQSTGEGVAQ
ncbi:MAG: tetratricopeptide repeat protein [Thermoanaerobaculia bacterium]